jgi:hypothetical protein
MEAPFLHERAVVRFPAEPSRAVPGRWGRRLLAFELVVLVEYFLAPAFFDLTNYAGLWSSIGAALFTLFVVSVVVLVVAPIWPRLREALRLPGNRALFHGVWVGAFVAGLFLTNLLQYPDGAAAGSLLVGHTTIYTPLGAWPSLTVYVGPIDLWATVNVEQPTLLFLLAFLSSAALVLSRVPRCAPSGPVPRRRTWFRRAGSVLGLGSLGFVTGCPTCFPAYFGLVALVAPAVAESTYTALPLVPWIGLAGLLYVAGFYLVLRTIERTTRDLSADDLPAEPA